MLSQNLLKFFFTTTLLIFFLLISLTLSTRVQAAADGLQQPVSRDAFTVSEEPVKKLASGLDQGKYELVVDSETISRSLQSDKGLINLKIEFASGSAQLTESAQAQILEIAKALRSADLGNEKIMITGHTDSVGSAEANLALSRQRALAVKKVLASLDIDSSRLNSRGLGESEPLADNLSADGRARNRRVTLSRQ